MQWADIEHAEWDCSLVPAQERSGILVITGGNSFSPIPSDLVQNQSEGVIGLEWASPEHMYQRNRMDGIFDRKMKRSSNLIGVSLS